MGELLTIQRENNMGTGFQKTATVMGYEFGAICKAIIYGRLDQGPNPGYTGEAKLALADLIIQCHVMAELLGADVRELVEIGRERLPERGKEWKDGVV